MLLHRHYSIQQILKEVEERADPLSSSFFFHVKVMTAHAYNWIKE